MKTTLFLAGVLSITLVIGCGKKSEENGTGKRINSSNESVSVKTKNDESKMDSAEKTRALKQQGSLKKGEAKPVKVGDSNFESEVLKSDIPVLVDFWAPWCGPCRTAGPVVEKMAQQYQGRLKVCKLNVDEARQTARKYGISSIPALKFFKKGAVIDQIIGITRNFESDLKKKIESNI